MRPENNFLNRIVSVGFEASRNRATTNQVLSFPRSSGLRQSPGRVVGKSGNYHLSFARLRNPLRSVDACWNMPENIDMDSGNNEAMILVTGATGHIGREVCRLLTEARWQILAVDLSQDKTQDVRACDLRLKSPSIGTVSRPLGSSSDPPPWHSAEQKNW